MRVISRVVRRLRKARSARRSLAVADFTDLRPIGNSRGGMITNRAGRAVFCARYKGRRVKIYEAYNPTHARFIAAVTELLPDLFPATVEIRGGWVIAEWIEGTAGVKLSAAEHLSFLRKIHEVAPQSLPPVGFDYWSDFILPRFMRAAAFFSHTKIAESVAEEVEKSVAHVPARLSHPDLTAPNLVLSTAGHLKCIDNELLYLGRLAELDLCNSIQPMPRAWRDQVASAWFAAEEGFPKNLELASRTWVVREAGAAFVDGRLDQAEVLLRSLSANVKPLLPFKWSD